MSSNTETKSTLRIGTRSSELALWQARMVRATLQKMYSGSGYDYELQHMSSLGDSDQMKPLSQFGVVGVFTKKLDQALLNGQIDCAVHCLKDLPTAGIPGIQIVALLPRGDFADVVCMKPSSDSPADKEYKSPQLSQWPCGAERPGPHASSCSGRETGAEGLSGLPCGALVGTSSVRRSALLRMRAPQVTAYNIRGNVHTRLGKLGGTFMPPKSPQTSTNDPNSDQKSAPRPYVDYAAVMLAKVGLERVALHKHIHQQLCPVKCGYAVGQGILAIACRTAERSAQLVAACDKDKALACQRHEDTVRAQLAALHDISAQMLGDVERGVLSGLGGGCAVPLAVWSGLSRVSATTAENSSGEGKDGDKHGCQGKCTGQGKHQEDLANPALLAVAPSWMQKCTCQWIHAYTGKHSDKVTPSKGSCDVCEVCQKGPQHLHNFQESRHCKVSKGPQKQHQGWIRLHVVSYLTVPSFPHLNSTDDGTGSDGEGKNQETEGTDKSQHGSDVQAVPITGLSDDQSAKIACDSRGVCAVSASLDFPVGGALLITNDGTVTHNPDFTDSLGRSACEAVSATVKQFGKTLSERMVANKVGAQIVQVARS